MGKWSLNPGLLRSRQSGLIVESVCFTTIIFKGFRPEWYVSTMICTQDIPFWSVPLDCLHLRELVLALLLLAISEYPAHCF